MNVKGKGFWVGVAMAGLMLCTSGVARAQGGQGQPAQQQQSDKDKAPAATPLSLDAAAPPVNAEEDAAFKAYQAVAPTDDKKKVEMGEAFLQKYPQSRYRPGIYQGLVLAYVQLGQVDKMDAAADKDLELIPNDVSTMAIVASTLPRAISSSTPPADVAKMLAKAEQDAKKVIELTPTMPKPANLSDESFAKAKNASLAAAHSGLGLVYFRRNKYAEAIPELETAAKLDPNPDPVNYFLLGICNEKVAHFDDAVVAFTKCAAIPSGMQATCKGGIEEAKKAAATQLSAPK